MPETTDAVPSNDGATLSNGAQPADVSWLNLCELFSQGLVIPFLGAGASAFGTGPGSSPPLGRGLLEKLAQRANVQADCGVSGCTHPPYDLARLASYYQMVVSTRLQLDNLIKTEISQPEFHPNSLHRVLARIARQKPLLILTTNYDDLLERAFEAEDTAYEIAVTPASDLAYVWTDDKDAGDNSGDLRVGSESAGGILHWVRGQAQTDFKRVQSSQLSLQLDKRSMIYKIHGSIPRGEQSPGYLIAEEDYARFLGRMDRNGNIVPEQIIAHIGKQQKILIGGNRAKKVLMHSIVFLGYGLHDWNLRVLLEGLQIGNKGRGEEKHYAFMRHPEKLEKELLEQRNVKVYDCDLARLADKLSQFFDRA